MLNDTMHLPDISRKTCVVRTTAGPVTVTAGGSGLDTERVR